MQFGTSTICLVVLFMTWSISALPVTPVRNVYDPHILHPHAGETFTAGETIEVTWDTSSLPRDLSNKGSLVLGYLSQGSEHLDLAHPLATGFLLTDGFHEVTFPRNLTSRNDYILDLFGDSGNISGPFTIRSGVTG